MSRADGGVSRIWHDLIRAPVSTSTRSASAWWPGMNASLARPYAVRRGGARARRRRSCHHLFLEGQFVVLRLRREDPRAGAEPAGHRPFAGPGPLGQPVHGQSVRAVLPGRHLAGPPYRREY
jgi:hypothetical protein